VEILPEWIRRVNIKFFSALLKFIQLSSLTSESVHRRSLLKLCPNGLE
jgi:hypothetical protein